VADNNNNEEWRRRRCCAVAAHGDKRVCAGMAGFLWQAVGGGRGRFQIVRVELLVDRDRRLVRQWQQRQCAAADDADAAAAVGGAPAWR